MIVPTTGSVLVFMVNRPAKFPQGRKHAHELEEAFGEYVASAVLLHLS
jgi:hypothetical protein